MFPAYSTLYDSIKGQRTALDARVREECPVDMNSREHGGKGRRFYWLLLLPLVAVTIPSIYNSIEPTLGGFPFFYWYQIAWVFITAGLTWFIVQREEA